MAPALQEQALAAGVGIGLASEQVVLVPEREPVAVAHTVEEVAHP